MALVAYDYSGSENEEDEQESTATVIINNKKDTLIIPQDIVEDNVESSISKLLPKSKPENKGIVEDKLEDFVQKKYELPVHEKVKEKVKITIPSLSQFENDDDDECEPEVKKPKITSKRCGLLSMLPPIRGTPLTTKSFVPKAVTRRATTNKPPANPNLVPNAVKKKAELAKKVALEKVMKGQSSSDAESDDDIEMPETFDEEMWNKVCGRPKPKEIVKIIEEEEPTEQAPEIDIAPEPVKPYDGLDNVAFKELVGKNRRPHLNYKLIDINEEEIIADKDLWLTKSMTDPDQAPKAVIDDEAVDPTRKKKHHITYLAEQAKANEQELQSQWSANKYTRNQTRAKYGF